MELRFPSLPKESIGLDDRLNHNCAVPHTFHFILILPKDLDHDRISIFLEVTGKTVCFPYFKGKAPYEVDEGDIIQW
jgi:hypothetical protein